MAAVAQRDALAAPQSEEVRVAEEVVEEEAVAQPDAAAVLRSEAAPDVRERRRAALPSAAGLSFRLPAARPAP